MRWTRWAAVALGLATATLAQAEPAKPSVRLEITSRASAYGGASFGEVGAYERLTGVAHLQIDPKAAANRGVVDLDRAPRDAQGLVKYDIDVVILRPRAPQKARRVMLYDVVNRGVKTVPSMLNGGSFTSMETAKDAGDGFALRQGFTLVFSGWQGDIAGPQMLGARFPVATDNGRPITGRISTETVFDDLKRNRVTLPYAAASLDPAAVRVTVRARADDPPRTLAAQDWRFEDDRHISLVRPADMDAGAIYRVSYVARDPKVMGLGFASVRDLVAFLRHADAAAGNPLADLAAAPCEPGPNGGCAGTGDGVFNTVVAFGASQSGRYLRDFVWQGFNRDLAGGRVFDGVIAMIPGGRRTFTNMRFSEPGRFSRQHEDHDVPGFDFPFAYASLRDPVTGKTDGILQRCAADGTCPKIFHIDTSAEFWQAGASLIGTGGGDRDVALPPAVRAYMITGGAHAPGMASPACQSPPNPMLYTPLVRGLAARMIDWTLGRQEPPASRWPSVERGELQPIEALKSPDLSSVGLSWPTVVNRPLPPEGRARGWPVLVPVVDPDGADRPGIRMPQVAAPDGTYLGWNLRKPGYAAGDLCLIFGAYVPFAKDAAGRAGDPRPSMAERYPQGDRAAKLSEAAAALGRDGLLLKEDVDALQASAR
ncbi:alpha/beta hydrolase domain-containing protein [Phenylobacterium sp. LjRoot219]|uniref:alpha/beta hydrolase domain-containing protein n=1 Tax=Phenylobacterium sp. LjRoot219 TaxID=3342283 RepID=UPI003ECDFF84